LLPSTKEEAIARDIVEQLKEMRALQKQSASKEQTTGQTIEEFIDDPEGIKYKAKAAANNKDVKAQ
jgi:hypothetical protein